MPVVDHIHRAVSRCLAFRQSRFTGSIKSESIARILAKSSAVTGWRRLIFHLQTPDFAAPVHGFVIWRLVLPKLIKFVKNPDG
jgi:hypothetical protein